MNKFNTAIVGSRSFNNYNYMKEAIDKVMLDIKAEISWVISGGARGADRLAERYADEFYLALMVFEPDWDKYGKSAGYKRNQKIIDHCHIVIAFWDGTSKGTKHSIDIATTQGKPVFIFKDWTIK